MERETVDSRGCKTAKHHSGLDSKQAETMGGKAVHTYEFWEKTSYAERAAIVVRATELMKLISDKHLRG